jgi:hypothetical protein
VEYDRRFSTMWSGMNDALAAGNKAAALQLLSPAAQERYGPVFDVLMPDYADVTSTWSSPIRGTLNSDLAEYGVIKPEADGTHLYLIYVVRDGSGVWHLDSM